MAEDEPTSPALHEEEEEEQTVVAISEDEGSPKNQQLAQTCFPYPAAWETAGLDSPSGEVSPSEAVVEEEPAVTDAVEDQDDTEQIPDGSADSVKQLRSKRCFGIHCSTSSGGHSGSLYDLPIYQIQSGQMKTDKYGLMSFAALARTKAKRDGLKCFVGSSIFDRLGNGRAHHPMSMARWLALLPVRRALEVGPTEGYAYICKALIAVYPRGYEKNAFSVLLFCRQTWMPEKCSIVDAHAPTVDA